MLNFKNSQKGFTAFYLTVLILAVVFTLGVSIYILTYGEQKISSNIVKSGQAYYAAEAGLEDALLRLGKNMKWSSSYSFLLEENEVNVAISGILGGARTITSTGTTQKRVRKVRVLYQLDFTSAALHYGAHIGDGGLDMAHNSAKIIGNVFSNGSVTGNGPATIVNSLIVAGGSNSVSNITVDEHVNAYSCINATVKGNLDYHALGTNTCTVAGGSATTTEIIEQKDFGITPEMIDAWKEDAAKGEEIIGDYTVNYDQTLGPAVITGNLHIDNNRKLTLRGTVLVTGNFTSNPNAVIKLDSNYGELSGVILAEGTVHVKNNLILEGSGEQGSFLLFASLSDSMDSNDPAIEVRNNADNAILFSPNGLMTIGNNADVVEILARRLVIWSAVVEYDFGLADTRFSSGPGAGWKVASWREIE